MGKFAWRFLGLVLLGGAIALVGAWLTLDSMARSAIERGATSALGVETRLAGLKLDPLAGRLQANNLTVRNPPGFTDPYLLQLQRFELRLAPLSLLSDTLDVRELTIDGLDIALESRVPKTNIATIGDRLAQARREVEAGKAPAQKKLRADRIVVKNARAKVRVSLLGRQTVDTTLNLPEVTLENVRNDDGSGLLLAEVILRIAGKSVEQAVPSSLPQLPNPTLPLPQVPTLPKLPDIPVPTAPTLPPESQ